MIEVFTDFNMVTEEGHWIAQHQRASAPVQRGERVLTKDGEGNECVGTVATLDEDFLYLAPDWDTWSPGE